jgi:hypothetical protein
MTWLRRLLEVQENPTLDEREAELVLYPPRASHPLGSSSAILHVTQRRRPASLDDRRSINEAIDAEGRRLRAELGLPPERGGAT